MKGWLVKNSWRLDRWDFILFGIWSVFVAWGVWEFSARKETASSEIIQYDFNETKSPDTPPGSRNI